MTVWFVSVAGASGDGAMFLHADGCGGAVGESLATADRDAVDVRVSSCHSLTCMEKSW